MSEGKRVQYQLKRIGKPATAEGVKDSIRITKDVTRFGRHSSNDFFLDSTEYLCLVSRWHTELHRVEQEGNIQYMLRDNSLNGTYINNIRVKGNQVLQEGDVVMFGHPNGVKIKPGEAVDDELTSEFSFLFERDPPAPSPTRPTPEIPPLFERVPLPPSPETSPPSLEGVTFSKYELQEATEQLLTSTDPLLAVPGSPIIPRVNTQHAPSRSLSSQETRIIQPVNRRLLVDGEPSAVRPNTLHTSIANTQGNTSRPGANTIPATSQPNTVTILKDLSNTGVKAPTKGLLHLDVLIRSHGTVSPGHIKQPPRNKPNQKGSEASVSQDTKDDVFALAAEQANKFGNDDSGSDSDIFDAFTPLNATVAAQLNRKTSAPSTPLSEMDSPSSSRGAFHSSAFNQPKPSTSHPSNLTKIKSEHLDTTLNSTAFNTTLSNNPPLKSERQFLPIADCLDTTIESSSPSLRRNIQQGRGVKRPRTETPPRNSPSMRQKNKKRRKGKRWTQVKKRVNTPDPDDDDEEEEEQEEGKDYHYDGDPCQAEHCYLPAGDKVSWVQCDNCDRWYHTVCAGTQYDAVNNSNTQFHCGEC